MPEIPQEIAIREYTLPEDVDIEGYHDRYKEKFPVADFLYDLWKSDTLATRFERIRIDSDRLRFAKKLDMLSTYCFTPLNLHEVAKLYGGSKQNASVQLRTFVKDLWDWTGRMDEDTGIDCVEIMQKIRENYPQEKLASFEDKPEIKSW